MHDEDRGRPHRVIPDITSPVDEGGGYPTMPPLDALEPDIEQEGEEPDAPESGWGGAARAAKGELPDEERDR